MTPKYAIQLGPRLVHYYRALEREHPGRWTRELAFAARYEAAVREGVQLESLGALLTELERFEGGGTAFDEMLGGVRALLESSGPA